MSGLIERTWLARSVDIKDYHAYPGGVRLYTEIGNLEMDIRLLGKMVDEWQKANPTIPFSLYREVPEPQVSENAKKQ